MGTPTARADRGSKVVAALRGVTYLLSDGLHTVRDSTVRDPRIRLTGSAGLGR